MLVFMLATGWSLGQAELLVTTLLTAARATTLQSAVVTARPRDACRVTRDRMSHVSYDSHVISRRRMADELPRVGAAEGGGGAGRSQELLDTEIARVGRELYCTVLYCILL